MKLSSKGRYAVMALADLAKFNLNLARSAKAITAYLPLLDSFMFSAIYGTYIYPTNLVKINTNLKTCILSLNFDRKNFIFFEINNQ